MSFSYDNQSKLLDEVEFSISKGSTIGLTGASGCGKSTFTDLMLGLLELDSGKIVIDGQALEEKDQLDWSSLIGYVPQDVYILMIRSGIILPLVYKLMKLIMIGFGKFSIS